MTPEDQDALELTKQVVIPIIDKHGLSKGGKIITEVGAVITRISQWPDDIKIECMEEFERIMKLSKSQYAKSRK